MSSGGVDTSRRRFLTAATSAVGGAGVAAAAYPFLASLQPSAREEARGAPVEVDVSKLEPGGLMTVEWRSKPIWIVRRTEAMLESLDEHAEVLRDPKSKESQQPSYAANRHRSIRPEILVLVAICTHLGCIPSYRPEHPAPDIHSVWDGGFFCPCHGSMYDLAGRVYQGVPAPLNLPVPPHRFAGESVLVVGEDKGAA